MQSMRTRHCYYYRCFVICECMSESHNHEPYKMATLIEVLFWVWTWLGPSNHVLDGPESSEDQGQLFSGVGISWPIVCIGIIRLAVDSLFCRCQRRWGLLLVIVIIIIFINTIIFIFHNSVILEGIKQKVDKTDSWFAIGLCLHHHCWKIRVSVVYWSFYASAIQ